MTSLRMTKLYSPCFTSQTFWTRRCSCAGDSCDIKVHVTRAAPVSMLRHPQLLAAALKVSRAASLSKLSNKPASPPLPSATHACPPPFSNDVRAAFPSVARQTSDAEAKQLHAQGDGAWVDCYKQQASLL